MAWFLVGLDCVNAQKTQMRQPFQPTVNDGAQATTIVNNSGLDGQPAVTAMPSKIGSEFWERRIADA